MDYSLLKHSHAGLAYLTILLFVGRFVLFYFYPVLRRNKVFKIEGTWLLWAQKPSKNFWGSQSLNVDKGNYGSLA